MYIYVYTVVPPAIRSVIAKEFHPLMKEQQVVYHLLMHYSQESVQFLSVAYGSLLACNVLALGY